MTAPVVFFEDRPLRLVREEVAQSPWGPCLIGFGTRGLARLSFEAASDGLRGVPPVHPLFGEAPPAWSLQLHGSAFEHAVWRALLAIPRGCTTTYGAIARQIGRPEAARAVGAAVGRNPIAWRVPCHRVLPAGGGWGGFRWGVALKRQLLAEEGVLTPIVMR